MKVYSFAEGFETRLIRSLAGANALYGPVRDGAKGCRLQEVASWEDLCPGELALIPLKKFLLPPRESLWQWQQGAFSPSSLRDATITVVGLPLCDLVALDYLDRVFEEDPTYRYRRDRLRTVGVECVPTDQCFCPGLAETPSFDLFLGKGHLWSASKAGDEMLAPVRSALSEPGGAVPAIPLPGNESSLPDDLEVRFDRSGDWPGWARIGDTCLSCGACSAVCPTCYCYQVIDEPRLDGSATRSRAWDNCFFREHALVAGGRNFRPGRKERLRFRFEHKWLGFGPLRGTPSCVGCGRCRNACPVRIDISEVLTSLLEETMA